MSGVRFREARWRGWSVYATWPVWAHQTFFTQFGFSFGVRKYPWNTPRRSRWRKGSRCV